MKEKESERDLNMGRGRGVVEVVGDGGHRAHEGEDRHREGQQSVGSVPK